MLRPIIYKNVQPNELPVLYRSVYFTWLGRMSTGVLLLLLILSPLDVSYAADEEVATSTDTTSRDTAEVDEPTDEPSESDPTAVVDTDDTVSTETTEIDSTATSAETNTTEQSDSIETITSTEESSSDTSVSSSDTVSTEDATESVTSTSTEADTEFDLAPDGVVVGAATSSDVANSSTTTSVATTTTVASTTDATTTSSSSVDMDDQSATTTAADESELDTGDSYSETETTEQASSTEESTTDTTSETIAETDATEPREDVADTIVNETPSESDAITASATNVSEASVTNNHNRYQFADSECVAVADGSFYCQKSDTAETTSATAVVTSKLDASGYSNIYIQDKDTLRPLTDNTYEDLAPHYDPVSETVVWHRNVEDVFQIISYDLQTDRETQITDASSNNMQPVQSGDVLVWQAWVDGAWQILLKDGDAPAQQLTSGGNNIAPYVSGGYVIWNVTIPNQPREVAVYELATGNLSYIDDPDGGQVTNPRFVLMYDTKFANGDTVTKGFDPETGQLVPLGALPAPTAPDIPSSDPVGETRALLQNKTNNEENGDDMNINTDPDPDPDTTTTTMPAEESGVADDSDFTLTIPTASTTSEVSSSTVSELTEYDVPIAPYGSTTETVSEVTNTNDDTDSSSATSTQPADS